MSPEKLLYKELDRLEKDYKSPIEIADGLELDYPKKLKQIEYYISSRYLNQEGDEDEVPFHNVVNANADVSKVATDFDTKDIRVESDDGEAYDVSFVFQKEIYDWMKRTNFAKTLNDMNSVRVDYGEVLVKKVMKVVDGKKELVIEIPEWQNLEVDASNILGRPIIENHYMTPAEFAKKSDIYENVKDVLKKAKNQEKTDGQILVKQISGEFPVAVYKECIDEEVSEDDNFTFGRYCFYVACLGSDRIYLYAHEDKENPYKKLCWKKAAKRPGKGVIEEGIPAQIWINDSIQKEQKWFELASKAILQTASKRLKGRNILSEMENGTILEHDDAKPITNVPLIASAVPEFQAIIDKWSKQYDRSTSISDVVRGENPPSGQAFRLQALVQQQSSSTFDHRREEMGIFIVELFNDWILPHLAKKFNKAHILSSDFSAEELKALDDNYSNYHANQWVKEQVLNSKIATQEDYESMKQSHKEFISLTKEKRFLDIPKDYYRDFKPKITIVTTGEQKNKQAVLESLSNLLTLYMSNPAAVQQDPVAAQLFSLVIEKSGVGVSPITLGLGKNLTPMQLQQQGMQQPGQEEKQSTIPNPNQLSPEAVKNEA
jgi:hypothetical protein